MQVDFAHPAQDLSGYKLVVAPASYLLTQESAANLTRFVEGGGTLLVSFFSGVVNEFDAVHEGGFLAPLRAALGVTVEEFLPLRAGETLQVALDGGGVAPGLTGRLTGSVWADDLTLAGATVVGTYLDGPAPGAPGAPAITRNVLGAGTGWYISTLLDVDALATVLAPVYADAGLAPSGLPEDLEVVRRTGAAADYVVVINHSGTDASVQSPSVIGRPGSGATDLVSGTGIEASLTVPAGGVRIVRLPHQA